MAGGFWVSVLGVFVIVAGSTSSSPTAVAIGCVLATVGLAACLLGVIRHSRRAEVSHARSVLAGLRSAFFWLAELP